MSFYDMHRRLWPRLDMSRFASIVRADTLAVARIEPTYSPRLEAFLDLAFERDGEWVVVPLLRVEGFTLLTREHSPVIWPASLGDANGGVLREVEERLLPWLRSLATGRFFNEEAVRTFAQSEHSRATFQAARDAGYFGAAPYREVFKSVAPGVYAQRFAREHSVAIAGPNAGNLLSVLSSVARECAVEHGDLSRQWFGGIASVALDRSRRYDCYAGPRKDAPAAGFAVFESDTADDELNVVVAEPIPMDVTVSFDSDDAPVARTFAVAHQSLQVSVSSLEPPVAVGGSAGTIALVVRDDAEKFPDADTEAAYTLASALSAEGFTATVTPAPQVDLGATDIIHVFGLRHGAGLVALLRDAEAARIPVVVTPYADDRQGEAVVGAHAALMLPRGAADPETLEEYYWALARRKISNITAGDLYDDASRVLMQRTSAALVSCGDEETLLRERFGYRGPAIISPPMVSPAEPDANVGAFVGPDQFVLIHASLDPTRNQLFGVRAAQRAGLPIVLLGPVANIEYFRYITDALGPAVSLLRDADLSHAQIEAIYARARVVADIGSTARGLERLGRGMAYGAAVVAPRAGYAADIWSDLVETVDPMDLESIVIAFTRAWNRQPQDALRLREAAASTVSARAGLLAAVNAYAAASSVPA